MMKEKGIGLQRCRPDRAVSVRCARQFMSVELRTVVHVGCCLAASVSCAACGKVGGLHIWCQRHERRQAGRRDHQAHRALTSRDRVKACQLGGTQRLGRPTRKCYRARRRGDHHGQVAKEILP